MESAVDVNQAALAIENKRMEDAALEIEAARRTREYSEVRKKNADDALTEWDTKGRELTSMNAALSWASAAANDQEIRYTGVRYDGARHDYEGTVEEFFDTVGEKREWPDWELQRNRIERQRAEAAAEVAMAQTREQQAQVRYEVQALNVILQQKRLEASQEVLEYSENRLFDEDLWFQLAAQLQDLARSYLDAAIYSALLMERAYDLEFDRRLNRIRTDYMLGVPAGLLGGDHLKRDILSFTSDYLENARKRIRCAWRCRCVKSFLAVSPPSSTPEFCRFAPIWRFSIAATPALIAARSRKSNYSWKGWCHSKVRAVSSSTTASAPSGAW